MKSYKHLFTKSLAHIPAHSHAAAHSHHLRPDIVLDAQIECAEDAFRLADNKWDRIFGEIIPVAQRHVADILNVDNPANIAFATNTHEFVLRLLSCFSGKIRILTTDSEFHSAARQFRRYEEEGLALITRIATEPFATFPARFAKAAEESHDLIFFSHVFFNSGHAIPDLKVLIDSVRDQSSFIVIDGYHGFMALPADLAALQDRVFYMAGGYKYAMSGEGSCFLYCPPGYGPCPVNTGWFAGYAELESTQNNAVSYQQDGSRFMGSTFDPSGLYRFNAVMDLLDREKITVADIRARVMQLQDLFLQSLKADLGPLINNKQPRGHFLTFRNDKAAALHEELMEQGIFTDCRGDRLRFGFGLYHDPDDMEKMARGIEDTL